MSRCSFFVNIHIPKCGGTTFRAVLARNFIGRYEDVYNRIWEAPYSADQIADFIDDARDFDCLSSHRLSLDLPFDRTERGVVALAFVREPAGRFFSHYFYERRSDSWRRRFEHLRNLTLEEFAEAALAGSVSGHLIDGQFRHLMVNVADPTFEKIEQLIAEGRLLPLPLERFDEALLVLRAMFPSEFSDLRYVRQNVSKKDQAVAPELRDRVNAHMPTDTKLCAAAHTWLDAKIDEHFRSRIEFDAELARSRQRRRRYSRYVAGPITWAKRRMAQVSKLLGA